ncbi:zeta toxin family protein [Nocardia sp. NPDC049220]|uniref:zeta toxin family protein n=1 Tax=Nocardia sp. NPDC049220 TaxID=3155273 RepID=UPI0033EB06D6
MIFGELSRSESRAAFADVLDSALGGGDFSLDGGFGPDTEQALIDLAFARAEVGHALIAKARSAFHAESAVLPVALPSHHDAVRLVLTRMAYCSLLTWQAVEADPPDIELAHRYRSQRRSLLARWTALDADQFDSDDVDSSIGTAYFEPTHVESEIRPPERLELSALAAIFDREIVPEIFPVHAPSDEPSAVLLCRSSEHPGVALRIATEFGCAAVDPDLLTAYHPHAAVSVDAGVRYDTLLWTVMAIRYAVCGRLDVVVQTAADEPQRTAEVAALFADSGYRVVVHSVDDKTVISPVASGSDP